MQSAGMEKIYRLTDNIMKLGYINLLTLFFTIIGLVVFGFFPDLTATFGIFRKWLTGFSDIPVTKSYWAIYKKVFIRANIIGGALSFIGVLLYVNLSIAEVINQKWVHLSYYPILLVIILLLCTSLYVFPVYLHFNITILQTFKNAFLLQIGRASCRERVLIYVVYV